jgi:hypothetical protein
MIHLFVEFGDHHRLDGGQKFGHGQGRNAERITECQCRRHVPADHRAGQHAKLATKTANQIPDLPTLMCKGPVQPRRAGFAGRFARFAVALAPAEGPLGKGAVTFFSCSNSRPLET